MVVLDINDAEVAATRDGAALYRQPGVALVDRDGAAFGLEALAKSRIRPRQSHNEFWQRLNGDPVKPTGRGVANQADLVYLHLQAIREAAGIEGGEPVVVVAPGLVTAAQLGMLLGIAAEAGLAVSCIVDSALAAVAAQSLPGPCGVVDVSLHRAFVTRIEFDDDDGGAPMARRGAVEDVPAAGFATLAEGWVDAVADRFVEGARFDPLRIAATEQQVFDQVLAGIDAEAAEFAIEVEHDDVSRHVNVARRAFAEKSGQRYRLLGAAIGGPTHLALTHRAARLPGLAEMLRGAGHDVAALPADAVAAGIAEHQATIAPSDAPAGDGARLVTSLPLRASGRASPAPAAPPPTHLLCGAIALPLGDATDAARHPAGKMVGRAFRIDLGARGVTIEPAAGAAVTHNGVRIHAAAPAATGDVIVCGDAEFRLIAAVEA